MIPNVNLGRIALLTALTLGIASTVTLTSAQTKPRTRAPRPAAHADAGVGTPRTEKAAPASGTVGGSGGEVVQTKTLDQEGTKRVFRFGELEIEGRLGEPSARVLPQESAGWSLRRPATSVTGHQPRRGRSAS